MSENPMDVLMQQKQDSVKKINDMEGVINTLEKDIIDMEKKNTTSMSVKRRRQHASDAAKMKILLKDQRETVALLKEIESLTDAVIIESTRSENEEAVEQKSMDDWLTSAKEALSASINDGPANQNSINQN